MNRRRFLATAATTPLTAGCLNSFPPFGSSPHVDPSVATYEFELTDEWPPQDDPEDWFTHDAQATFDEDATQIVVIGRFPSGGRSCRETYLHELSVNDTNSLTIVVVDRTAGSPSGSCTAEEAVVPYRATITFESELPQSVTVEHIIDGEDHFEEIIHAD